MLGRRCGVGVCTSRGFQGVGVRAPRPSESLCSWGRLTQGRALMWNSEDSVDLFYVRMLKQKSVHVISSTLKARHRPHLRTYLNLSSFVVQTEELRSREMPSHFTVNGGRAGGWGGKKRSEQAQVVRWLSLEQGWWGVPGRRGGR